MSTKKANMEVFLLDIYKNYIAIKDADNQRMYEAFRSIFAQVTQKMAEVDKYFGKYYNTQTAGSVYDGIKVGKLDEFDMDIVIKLPINYNDIVIEYYKAGFVQLKIGKPFDNLVQQQDWEEYHKVTRKWRDDDKYLLQNEFRGWLQGIVQKAINLLDRKLVVGDTTYTVEFKESGPAFTLNIRGDDKHGKFELDVDLVPVIRFLHPRWPEGYRPIEGSKIREWYVVPKPIKNLGDKSLKNRCWRLAFHDYERELIKGYVNLKPTIRLVKKLRNSLGIKQIASYYIKTLFLWEIHERKDKKYWQQKFTILFRDMVARLHKAIEEKRISYFWNSDYNLIEELKPSLQKVYCDSLQGVLNKIDKNDVEGVVINLLTPTELSEFKNSDLYKMASFNDLTTSNVVTPMSQIKISKSIVETDGKASTSTASTNNQDMTALLQKLLDSNKRIESKMDSIVAKMKNLEDKIEMTVKKMERDIKVVPTDSNSVRELLIDNIMGTDILQAAAGVVQNNAKVESLLDL